MPFVVSAQPVKPKPVRRRQHEKSYNMSDLKETYAPFLPEEEKERKKKQIAELFDHYSIQAQSIEVHVGPAVSLYEVALRSGTRITEVRELEDDLLLTLPCGARIIAPLLGRVTVGVELPNDHPARVPLLPLLEQSVFQSAEEELPIPIGRTTTDGLLVEDLTRMHHLLVGGATGQGKSAFLHALITTLLSVKQTEDLKLVLFDPKQVEFGMYSGLGAYLAQLPDGSNALVHDVDEALDTLLWLCAEMAHRFKLLDAAGVKDVQAWNRLPDGEQAEPLPYIVVVMDEYADFMMSDRHAFEQPLCRLLQGGHRAGIHVVMTTQRASMNIVTGIITANVPARVAFRVSSQIESRILLDAHGAECLAGRGDLLFSFGAELTRAQGVWVDMPEIDKVMRQASERGHAEQQG